MTSEEGESRDCCVTNAKSFEKEAISCVKCSGAVKNDTHRMMAPDLPIDQRRSRSEGPELLCSKLSYHMQCHIMIWDPC